MKPRFSVIIPCYNQAHFLRDAIDSALIQRPVPQIIVVDDGSTDSTSEVAKSYGNKVRLIRQQNAGLAAARNAGILQADGEFLVFLDSDDSLRPGYVEQADATLRAFPDTDVLHGRADVVDLNGNIVASFGGAELGPDPVATLMAGCDGPPNTWIVRRSLLSKVGLFFKEPCEDWDMWIRCALAGGRFHTDASVVAVYRDVPASMSKRVEFMWRGQQALADRHRRARGKREDVRALEAAALRSARSSRASLARLFRAGQKVEVLRILVRNPRLTLMIVRTLSWR